MRIYSLISLSLLLSACSALTPTGQLSLEYAKAARQIGITPVYPPREEFQVGDVFLVSVERDDPNNSASVWLDSLPSLRQAAEKFLRTRVVFEDTGVLNAEASSTSGKAQVDLFSPEISTRGSERVLSLPVAAFPSIVTQAGSTESTGLVGAMAALGFGSSDQTTVTLDFNDVRSYGEPQVLAADYQADAALIAKRRAELGAEEMADKVATIEYNQGRKSHDRCLELAVVTRVYLTREIDYTYRDRAILAAGLKFSQEQGKLSQAPTPPTINVQIQSSATNAKPSDIDSDLADAAEKMRVAVASATNQTGEGGAFSFTSWNARGLTFKQVYPRPVAIGWEGMTLDLDPGEYDGQPSCLGAKPLPDNGDLR